VLVRVVAEVAPPVRVALAVGVAVVAGVGLPPEPWVDGGLSASSPARTSSTRLQPARLVTVVTETRRSKPRRPSTDPRPGLALAVEKPEPSASNFSDWSGDSTIQMITYVVV